MARGGGSYKYKLTEQSCLLLLQPHALTRLIQTAHMFAHRQASRRLIVAAAFWGASHECWGLLRRASVAHQLAAGCWGAAARVRWGLGAVGGCLLLLFCPCLAGLAHCRSWSFR